MIAQVKPGLGKNLHLLFVKIDVDLRGHGPRPRLARVQIDDVDAALFQVKDLLAVRAELRVAFEPGGRSELPRDGGLPRQFVQRVNVEILLAYGARRNQRPFSVGADRMCSGVNADGQRAQPLPYVFENDLNRLLILFSFVRRGVRRGSGALRLARSGSRLLPRRGRLLFEQVSELILAEFRRTWDQIDARQAAVFGTLVRIEQNVFAVRAPRE